MITVREIAWAAGIYEGEGNFSGTHVIIAQKDTWILHKLRNMFGFGTITKHGECNGWVIAGGNARGFLLTIFSELSPRRKAEILKHKIFFIDPLFRCQTVCRNGHVKTNENTRKKYNHRRKAWDWVCLECRNANTKRYWQKKDRMRTQIGVN